MGGGLGPRRGDGDCCRRVVGGVKLLSEAGELLRMLFAWNGRWNGALVGLPKYGRPVGRSNCCGRRLQKREI